MNENLDVIAATIPVIISPDSDALNSDVELSNDATTLPEYKTIDNNFVGPAYTRMEVLEVLGEKFIAESIAGRDKVELDIEIWEDLNKKIMQLEMAIIKKRIDIRIIKEKISLEQNEAGLNKAMAHQAGLILCDVIDQIRQINEPWLLSRYLEKIINLLQENHERLRNFDQFSNNTQIFWHRNPSNEVQFPHENSSGIDRYEELLKLEKQLNQNYKILQSNFHIAKNQNHEHGKSFDCIASAYQQLIQRIKKLRDKFHLKQIKRRKIVSKVMEYLRQAKIDSYKEN